MADLLYCTPEDVVAIAGQMAVDLRTDDVTELAAHFAGALSYGAGRVDFYCGRYSQAVLAGSRFIKDVAALAAVRWMCIHRLNNLPASVEAEWGERLKELELIRTNKAEVPRAAKSRRAVTVTNSTVDLNRFNNQVRVDRNRSTGVAKEYRRPTAETPDER